MLTTFQIHSSISVMVCLDVVCCAEYNKTENLKNRGEGEGREPRKKSTFLPKLANLKQVQPSFYFRYNFPLNYVLEFKFPSGRTEIQVHRPPK